MKPIFSDPDLCIALCQEAQSWIGTPFHKNGRVKQGGVDCINLVQQIYLEVLKEEQRIEFPPYNLDETFHNADSRLQAFLDAHPRLHCVYRFDEDEPHKLAGKVFLPGDLLGFRFGQAMHHLGLSLGMKKFIHCRQVAGTVESWLDDATYEFRLLAVYRPLK